MTNYKIFYFNVLRTACTVLWSEDGRCAIADPGCQDANEKKELTDFIAAEGLTPAAILLTHGHPDHICAARWLQDLYGIPVRMNPAEKEYLPIFRKYGADIGMDLDISFRVTDAGEGQVIEIGKDLRFKVIGTPGHSAGGVCYYDEAGGILVAGDTLFNGAIGRSDLHGGDYDVLIGSILEKIISLPSDTLVIPGHGMTTTIGHEAASNPFLEPFNTPMEDF